MLLHGTTAGESWRKAVVEVKRIDGIVGLLQAFTHPSRVSICAVIVRREEQGV